MSNRLDRIDNLNEDTGKLTQSNASAIQASIAVLKERQTKTDAMLANLTATINQTIENQKKRQAATRQRLQTMLEERKAYRAESQRQLQAFREETQSMINQLSTQLNQIADRIASNSEMH